MFQQRRIIYKGNKTGPVSVPYLPTEHRFKNINVEPGKGFLVPEEIPENVARDLARDFPTIWSVKIENLDPESVLRVEARNLIDAFSNAGIDPDRQKEILAEEFGLFVEQAVYQSGEAANIKNPPEVNDDDLGDGDDARAKRRRSKKK